MTIIKHGYLIGTAKVLNKRLFFKIIILRLKTKFTNEKETKNYVEQ